MPNTTSNRRKSKATSITDAILGILIPVAFLGIAAFQLIHQGSVDREIVGALLIITLGALGWRIDIIVERFLEYKATGSVSSRSKDSDDDNSNS